MLTEESLRALIAEGEQFTVEFKGEERQKLPDQDLLETVVCLANGRGGWLLLGVEDDGRITGARPRGASGAPATPRQLEAFLANNTVPSCPTRCQMLELDGLTVVAIEVPEGLPITATRSGVAKRRAWGGDNRPACVPFHYHEMQARAAGRGLFDPSAQVLPEARWEDLDPLEFERLRQTINRNRGRADAALLELSDEDLFTALGLGEGTTRVERIRLAGLLLLGREAALRQLVPTHEVSFQVLAGTQVQVNDFMRVPLLRAVEDLQSRFVARNQEQEVDLGAVRMGIPDYSPAGFREALHNALVHRDYGSLGAVHVQWRENQLEISNPGGFVEGITIENLLVTPPRPRNPILADAFKRLGLVERTDRGVDTIYEGQLRYGRPAPDYSRTTQQGVHVLLHGGEANLELAQWIVEHDQLRRPVTVDEMLVINALEHERCLSVPVAARLMQRSDETARALLERLVEQGILESRGTRARREYQFSAATYRALGQPAAYTRVRGFEPIQQEHMVLQYVRSHGQITRMQVCDLCQISDADAKSLLQRMIQQAQLRLVSNRRWSYYTLAEE
ncbi:MAG TPA: ATP-binding protein [Hymenobacter sp.]|uniref:ATP-binding protein n=1 Tax=Hymenobacter sp. TaxID=1898978 RepID=UPI002D80F476|nr:ATP-binding protein [Hymenobacter sp.]HET9504816.1 ATP-binding protein [Hymenobacter sp.]